MSSLFRTVKDLASLVLYLSLLFNSVFYYAKGQESRTPGTDRLLRAVTRADKTKKFTLTNEYGATTGARHGL